MPRKDTPTNDKIKSIINTELQDCIGLSGDTLSTARASIKSLYLGEPLPGDKELGGQGWSTYQDRSVMEVVEWAKPGLLRIFASADEVVRFEPRTPADEQAADDATKYINDAIFGQNAFTTIHDAITDALYQRAGWIKAWYEDKTEPVTDEYTGLSADEAVALMALKESQNAGEGSIEIEIEIEPTTGGDIPLTPGEEGTYTYSVKVSQEQHSRGIRLEAVAPEKIVYAADTVDVENCRFIAQWEDKPRAELAAEGYDIALLEDLPGGSATTYPETEVQNLINSSDADAESNRSGLFAKVRIYEAYVLLAEEGKPSRYKVVFAGDEDCKTILSVEPWAMPQPPFFPVRSLPLPHAPVGLCLADLVSDVQLLRTELYRKALDNLTLQNQGENLIIDRTRTGRVDLDQFLSRHPGGVYHIEGDVDIAPLQTSNAAGAQAAQMVQMTDQVKESRTGIGQNTQGINAEALQGTATGAGIFDEAINQRNEMIARFIADDFKRLAIYCLKLMVRYHTRPLEAHIAGHFLRFEPRMWDANWSAKVTVGLGTGNRSRQSSALQAILQLQEKFTAALGVNSPVRLTNIMYAAHKFTQSVGFSNPEQFFGTIEDAERAEQAIMQQQQQAGQQDPTAQAMQMQMQLEQQKAQQQAALAQEKARQEAALAQQKAQADMELERQKAADKLRLETEKYAAELQIEREKMQLDDEREAQRIEHEARLDALKIQMGQTGPGLTVIRR